MAHAGVKRPVGRGNRITVLVDRPWRRIDAGQSSEPLLDVPRQLSDGRGHQATLNCAIDSRRSAARSLSWAAADAACLEPTAYCRETSETCVIALTTWSEADRCC